MRACAPFKPRIEHMHKAQVTEGRMNVRKLFICLAAVSMFAVACKKDEATTTTETAAQEAPKTETAAQAGKTETAAQEAPAEEGQWAVAAKYGVKFRVPEDWKINSATEEAVSATSPDDTITIILVGTESEGVFEAAMGSVTSAVQIKDIKTEKSQMTVINGLGGFHGSGSAVLTTANGDQGIQFLGYALRLDAEKAVAVMVFAEAEMYEARKEELEAIARTIQKS